MTQKKSPALGRLVTLIGTATMVSLLGSCGQGEVGAEATGARANGNGKAGNNPKPSDAEVEERAVARADFAEEAQCVLAVTSGAEKADLRELALGKYSGAGGACLVNGEARLAAAQSDDPAAEFRWLLFSDDGKFPAYVFTQSNAAFRPKQCTLHYIHKGGAQGFQDLGDAFESPAKCLEAARMGFANLAREFAEKERPIKLTAVLLPGPFIVAGRACTAEQAGQTHPENPRLSCVKFAQGVSHAWGRKKNRFTTVAALGAMGTRCAAAGATHPEFVNLECEAVPGTRHAWLTPRAQAGDGAAAVGFGGFNVGANANTGGQAAVGFAGVSVNSGTTAANTAANTVTNTAANAGAAATTASTATQPAAPVAKVCTYSDRVIAIVKDDNAPAGTRVQGEALLAVPTDAFDAAVRVVFVNWGQRNPTVNISGHGTIFDRAAESGGTMDLDRGFSAAFQQSAPSGQVRFWGGVGRATAQRGPVHLNVRISGTYKTYGNCLP